MTHFCKCYPEKVAEQLVVEAAKMAFEEYDLKILPDELRGRQLPLVFAVRRWHR